MVNNFKKISVRPERVETHSVSLPVPFKGADLRSYDAGGPATTTELKFLSRIIRTIREALLGRKRQKNELAQIIAQAFGFDNTRIYVKGERDNCHLLGEFSRGSFRTVSTYENGSTGKNKIFHELEAMAKEGKFILRFDLRYALFLWEDDPDVMDLIRKLGLKRDEEQIELLRRLAPNKADVLADINYYLTCNMYLKRQGVDIKQALLETTFIALVNGENRVHGYIMANNFITGRPIEVDEDLLRGISETILDTYKIYGSLENERDKAQKAERDLLEQNMRLHEVAIRDEKTGLYSARYYSQVYKLELERAKKEQTNLGVTLIDIDHFKKINDTYGHLAADYVLKELGRIIMEECRKFDVPCRFGGEELVILSPSTDDILHLVALARRLRHRINNTTFLYTSDEGSKDTKKIKITVSIGIAMGALKGLFEDADRAMYHSKSHGRNKIVAIHPETASLQTLLPDLEGEDKDAIVFIE